MQDFQQLRYEALPILLLLLQRYLLPPKLLNHSNAWHNLGICANICPIFNYYFSEYIKVGIFMPYSPPTMCNVFDKQRVIRTLYPIETRFPSEGQLRVSIRQFRPTLYTHTSCVGFWRFQVIPYKLYYVFLS